MFSLCITQETKTEIVEFPSYDGELVEGYLFKPKGNGSFPAVVLVHGGRSSRRSTIWMAKNIGNMFVERGYVTLTVNYRDGPIGLQDVEDTIAAIEFLKTLNFIDPQRIGFYDGSHGGYIALMCEWKTDVKAAVEAAGFCDLREMMEKLLLDEKKRRWAESMMEFFGGTVDKVSDVYLEYSPCAHVTEFKAAVFIIHGRMDNTLPIEQAYKLSRLLEQHGKIYEIYISEKGEHGFYHKKTEEASKVWNLIFEFFDRYLKSRSFI